MFRAHSPYSPFFTSGLLSEPISARRTVFQADIQSIPSTIYFDVEFSDDVQYRSFLSLDLAETQSTRSMSLKRKASSSKHNPRASTRSRLRISSVQEVSSRRSLRSVPSPKPIPSTNLPPPPVYQPQPSFPPSLPPLPTLPSLELDLSASSQRRKKSNASSSSPPSICPPTRQPSTVSTRTRLRNRATALALLEGRQKPVVAIPPRQPRNFMSMSDDEDEGEDEDNVLPRFDTEHDSPDFFNPSFEPEDIVLPAAHSTNSFPPSRAPRSSNGGNLTGRKASQRRVKRKSKAGEWFPLKSFIDLYNENDDDYATSWNWRSFIEVSALS